MYLFIINPAAGGGKAMRVFEKIKQSNVYQKMESYYKLTSYKGHAEKIVNTEMKRMKRRLAGIIVISGDGTLHEVVNGMGPGNIPLAFIPGGSGNDFARGCSIAKDPIEIITDMIEGKRYLPYYLGRYQIEAKKSRLFANSIGFGFDAEIAKTVNESKYKKRLNRFGLGKLSYIIAIIQVLLRFKRMDIEVEINGEKRMIHNCWMVTITNHPYYGGGMKIIPTAKIQARTFPVLLVHSIPKWKILALFMTVFTGKHTRYKGVELIEATKLSIQSDEMMHYQVDGETDVCYHCQLIKGTKPMKVMGTKQNTLHVAQREKLSTLP